MKHPIRTPVIALSTAAGLVVLGLVLRGTLPELVRYMRIRRM